MTEDERVGWLHQLNGHGFWWTLGVVVQEKILESPLDCKEIKLVSPKVNQP